MPTRFPINFDLFAEARSVFAEQQRLYWIVGGAGAGKTTVCRLLSARYGLGLYDMDERVYGSYHGRFTQTRHPVNSAWSDAADGLAWLLALTWEEFDQFNRAALAEYVDLLADDLRALEPQEGLLIDGGICTPALLLQVMPADRIVCLAERDHSSVSVWTGSEERRAMQSMIRQLPNPDAAWDTFLDFDTRITATMLQECRENDIPICIHAAAITAEETAAQVALLCHL